MSGFIMKGTLFVVCLFIASALSLGFEIANADIDSKEVVTDTFEGNHLFTSKFERGDKWCTAVFLRDASFLTSAHCIDYKNSKEVLGYMYPAQSGTSTPLSYFSITEGIVYKEYSTNRIDDIAIAKSSDSNFTFNRYMKDRNLKIKVVDNINDFIDKKVYTIGYASDMRNNYQIKRKGVITHNWNNAFRVDVSVSGGQSGSGVYLEESDELIGILEGGDQNTAFVTPVTKEVKDWIDRNK